MDMIILAAIAAFIVYRLYVTLGEKTGFQGDEPKPSNVVDLHAKPAKAPVMKPVVEDIPKHLVNGVKAIQKKDVSFSLSDFKEKATQAFEIILDAYTEGDLETLKVLLSKDLYGTFEKDIKDRNTAGHSLDNTLVRIDNCHIDAVHINGSTATINLEFTTEQVPLVKDKAGEIIDGNPNQIDEVVDRWVFEKSLTSKNPRWVLVSTEW